MQSPDCKTRSLHMRAHRPDPPPPPSEQPTCGGMDVTHSARPTRPIFQQPFVNGTVITLLFYPVQPTNNIVPHYTEVSSLLFRRWCEPCQRFLDRQSSVKIIIQKQGECVFFRRKKKGAAVYRCENYSADRP